MAAEWIITVFVIIDDTMQIMGHKAHSQAKLSDSEILLISIIAAKYFNNNHKLSLLLLYQLGYLANKLDPSRFNRRLHALADWYSLIAEVLAVLARQEQVFVIDSLPVPVCKFVRRWRCHKVAGRAYVGYCAAKKERFFGYRLHLICTPQGKVAAYNLLPASYHDLTPIHELTYCLAPGSKVYGDKGYNCLAEETTILAETGVYLIPQRRKNMENHCWQIRSELREVRKRIETTNSQLEKFGLERLYARTIAGFELKVQATLLALAFTNY